jgi:hypothetical protein
VRRGDGAFGSLCAGKYLDVAAAVDIARDPELAEKLMQNPRGRMDDYSWGKTLYRYRSAGDAFASKGKPIQHCSKLRRTSKDPIQRCSKIRMNESYTVRSFRGSRNQLHTVRSFGGVNHTLFEASKNFEGSDPTMFEDSNE